MTLNLPEYIQALEEERDEARSRVKEMELEVARLDAGWEKANGRAHEVGLERTHLKSLLTPRRIDEGTPDGVQVWVGDSWIGSHRGLSGDWKDFSTGEYFDDQPTWWLPMLPAPEEDES